MVDELVMPEPLARPRIERDQAVGEQVVSRPVTAVEVEACGAKGMNAIPFCASTVNSLQFANAACFLVRPFRPRVVAELTGMRMLWKTQTIFPVRRHTPGRQRASSRNRRLAPAAKMMIKFSKMRPGLLVCSGFRASRHRATRRSTRPFVPNGIASPFAR